jgi:dTMP kinase
VFITLEGSDGSGKTTQAQRLIGVLQARGYSVYHTREPGGTPIGDQIRAVLHSLENTAMHPQAEVLLYAASRAQLVAQVIRPRLAAGDLVLCDRYVDSTLAYQGYGHGLDLAQLHHIQTFATGGLKPDLTLYFDMAVEAALERRKHANAEWNRMDSQALDFYRRVRAGYLALVAAEPQRWITVDAAQAPEAVHQEILAKLLPRLPPQIAR